MSVVLEQKKIETKEIIDDILNHLSSTNRNLVSDEFEDSLKYLEKYIDLTIHHYKTGTECWTWNVPPKWRVRDGYIKHNGKKIVSFKDHPLHIMSYSVAIDKTMKGEELLDHIHVHKEIPRAIPYEFSYYVPKWGFCMTHEQRDAIKKDETYEVLIDSDFTDNFLSVGEYTIKGSSREHIFFLSHIDHPFQVNDGLVGVAVHVALAKMLEQQKDHYYNYTFLFGPETIGSIAFLSNNEQLIPNIRYSVFVEMVGFNNPLVIQRSFKDRGLINQYAAYALKKQQGEAKNYPFLTVAGNDEKIFDSPGVNIPSISLTRIDQEARLINQEEKGDELIYPYPEYHSHLDNLMLTNSKSVCDTVTALYSLCQIIDKDFIPKRKFKGPVFLTKYGLWPDWRTDLKMNENMMWLMYALEGDKTVFQIAEELDVDFDQLVELLNKFYDQSLITKERIPIEFDR